jgi:hypothetical protein
MHVSPQVVNLPLMNRIAAHYHSFRQTTDFASLSLRQAAK